jgi:8-oxo-dGTP pyrophosphatase MutT (NUDIX family)
MSTDPASTDPASTDPASTDRMSTDPVSTDRMSTDPVSTAGRLPPGPAGLPGWLGQLAAAAAAMPVPAELRVPAGAGRRSAVLILFADSPGGPDVLLIQRSPWLRRHAGQPAFPGGAVDGSDAGPAAAAVREAAEEALVSPDSVEVLAVLPELYISRSGFRVTPVLAWWRRPGPVGPGDPAEVTSVARIPVAELADPANRSTVRYPSGHSGPAFAVSGMLVWGFTAMLLDRLLVLGGWERPWDRGRVTDLPPEAVASPADSRVLDSRLRPGS